MTLAPRPSLPRMDVLMAQAAQAKAAENYPALATALRSALALSPRDPRLMHDLGLALMTIGQEKAALAMFDRAVAVSPGFALAHFRRGEILERLGLAGAALAYGRAIEAGLRAPEVFSRLARLLLQAGMRDDAAAQYRQAASLAPNSFAGLVDRAMAAMLEGRLEDAERNFRIALAQRPDGAEAAEINGHLAHLLTARGRFEDAAAALERALTLAPERVGLFYDLVKTRRVTADDADLPARLEAASGRTAQAGERLKLALARAKVCDDLGDVAGAEAALDAADALRTQASVFDRSAVAETAARVERLFTPAYMAHPRHQGSLSDAPILVVGMPRSGTTLVEQILSRHPHVAGAGEVPFWEAQGRAFVAAADPALGADLREVAEAYLARLRRHAPAAPRVVDKMPYNFRWAALVHLALPNARIVHVRRGAAPTCLSIMETPLPEGAEFSACRRDLAIYYRHYRRLVAQARALLPGAAWFDLTYEDLVRDPETQIRALLSFCGLDWNEACLSPERSNNAVLTFSQFQARQPIDAGSADRWRRHGGWLGDFAVLDGEGG